jgi:peroxygenase
MRRLVKKLCLMLVLAGFSPALLAETALQRHVQFFDENGDGHISSGEIYSSARRLGLGRLEAAKMAGLVSFFLGPKTSGCYLGFNIKISNIQVGIHDSDTGVYDKDGNFCDKRLRKLIHAFDADKDGALSVQELESMHAEKRKSFNGDRASRGEFDLLMQLGGENRDVNGAGVRVLTYEVLKEMYDGKFFYRIANEVALKKKNVDPDPEL